jgi:site-specific recombinase
LAAAASTFGVDVLAIPAFWLATLSVPVIGLANIAISFYCSFRLAVKANAVNRVDQIKIRKAVFQRLSARPSSFLWPISKSKLPKKGVTQ